MNRLAVLLGVIILASLFVNAVGQSTRTVSAPGEGTVEVPADISMITVSVESKAENATIAATEMEEKLNQTIDALLAAGVKREEVLPFQATSVVSITSSSKNCWKENNTTSCKDITTSELKKSIVINLETTDQEAINRVIGAAESVGAEAFVDYGLSDLTSAATDARKKAVENARNNAQEMATAAGARLGKVLNIYGSGYPYSIESDKPGMVDVTYNIVAIYELIG
ncbi:MAG: SIMPL domain-containing protein [Methanotrichaceae archaeon]|nr:SIMPL domain-containing protein [Methanotrichaceae archaeon]